MSRHRQSSTFACFLFLACLAIAVLTPVAVGGEQTPLFPDLHPGVRIYQYEWAEEACVLYVAEMERRHSDLHVEAMVGADTILGKESVQSMAERRARRGDRRVLVAVNGGFGVLGDMKGYGGVLENLHVQDGELMTQPTDKAACFGVTSDGQFLVGPVEMEAEAAIGTHTFPIESINQRHLDGFDAILYTPRLGETTRTHARRAYEIVITGLNLPITPAYESEFVVSKFGQGGDNAIPKDGGVLSFRSRLDKALAAQLREGERGHIRLALKPAAWHDVVHAIGGRLKLVTNGEINEQIAQMHHAEKEHTPGKRSENLVLSYEPRTALGFNDDKLFLIVADGRQPGYSTGLTLYGLASVFVKLGAKEVINLDGGSSSTFVVNGEVVNRPAGQDERDVLNAVLITADKRD